MLSCNYYKVHLICCVIRTTSRKHTRYASSSAHTLSWDKLFEHKKYDPSLVEDPYFCQSIWNDLKRSDQQCNLDDRPRFAMLFPPPNITGDLHLGHALTATIQDAICRWHRMSQRTVVWVPGLDHAGLATQAVVERLLAGGSRRMDRLQFLTEAWKWKESHQSNIYNQLRNMGLFFDWNLEYFTLSPEHTIAVNEAFFRLFNDGLIYRSKSLINWCCHFRSAVSDIEVEHRQVTKPTHIKLPGYSQPQLFGFMDVFDYKLIPDTASRSSSSPTTIPVATTRLETMLGDTALAVHPGDPRYSHLIGRRVQHPFSHTRSLPIIGDAEFVDPDQGTGVLKVSPGHSLTDWKIALRHQLKVINTFTKDGCINDICGSTFEGVPRFLVRSSLIDRLSSLQLYRGRYSIGESSDCMSPVAPITLPLCSRSGDVIEPLLREQWFIKVDALADAAIQAVSTGRLRFSSLSQEVAWHDWLQPSRRQDWCISRQIFWGHRIPAYRLLDSANRTTNTDVESAEAFDTDVASDAACRRLTSDWVAARSLSEASQLLASRLASSANEMPSNVEQDSDVLDTWFSSALLPFASLGWPKNTPLLQRFFPLDVMITGQDILFFWVARMVMLGLHLTGLLPFKKVILHGLICDSSGKKMSKSKGNTIDPLTVIHGKGLLTEAQIGASISTLGADALRASLLSTDFTKQVVVFSPHNTLEYRRFGNKVWQSIRFLKAQNSALSIQPLRGGCLRLEDLWSSIGDRWDAQELASVDKWIILRTRKRVSDLGAAFASQTGGSTSSDTSSGTLHNCVTELRNWWVGDLCSVYLEVIKARIRKHLREPLAWRSERLGLDVFSACALLGLHLLHPIMPHLSEALWQAAQPSGSAPSLLTQQFPLPSWFEFTGGQEASSRMENQVSEVLASVSVLKAWSALLRLRGNSGPLTFSLSDEVFTSHPILRPPEPDSDMRREIVSSLTNLLETPFSSPPMAVDCGCGLYLNLDINIVDLRKASITVMSSLQTQKLRVRSLEWKQASNESKLSRSELIQLSGARKQIAQLEKQLEEINRLTKNGVCPVVLAE